MEIYKVPSPYRMHDLLPRKRMIASPGKVHILFSFQKYEQRNENSQNYHGGEAAKARERSSQHHT
jgi:hypothetical protein